MLNQIQENPFVINVPITATFKAGDVVIDDSIVGIAVGGGESGSTIAVLLAGIVQLAADNATAFTFGEPLFWSGSQVVNTPDVGVYLGICALAKSASTAVAQVLLNVTNSDISSSSSASVAFGKATTIADTGTTQSFSAIGAVVSTSAVIYNVFAQMDTLGNVPVSIISATVAAADAIKVIFSADPGNDHVISFDVRKAIYKGA